MYKHWEQYDIKIENQEQFINVQTEKSFKYLLDKYFIFLRKINQLNNTLGSSYRQNFRLKIVKIFPPFF